MAEAFPENVPDNSSDTDQEKSISVLVLATKWQFDTYGLSTVNKSLVNNLRVVDPEGKKIKITCAVLEEDRNISHDQREDAEKYNVKLNGAKQPRGPKKKPTIEWLDNSTAAYYLDLVRENLFDFIIGHVPYLANGPLNIRDLYPKIEQKPKVIFMIHDLPRTTEGDTDEELLGEWLSEAEYVLSVGKEVESEIFSAIKALPETQQPIHQLYVPGYPLELFKVQRRSVSGNEVRGTQHVTLMIGNNKNMEISGINFSLAVAAVSKASKHIRQFDSVKTNFVMMTESKEDKEAWKKEFTELVKGQEVLEQALNFQHDSLENFEKLTTQLRKSNLMILPLKPQSPLFGTEVLSTIAAGVPVLVSNHSGMAALLEMVCQDESVVKESTLQSNVDTWREGILQKLLRPEDSQKSAKRLREDFLLDTSIAQTHMDFIRSIVGTSSFSLQVEIDSDSVVGQEHIDKAIKFGIDFGEQIGPVEAKKYVLAFIQKLFLQREKLDLGHLTDYLQSNVSNLWQEVLSTLENSNRKLLDVQSGSVIFTLFCPSVGSTQELRDDFWIKHLSQKMEQLVHEIGVESRLRIHPPEDVRPPPKTELLPRLREIKLRHTAQSDGYETMTQHSSDVASEVFPVRSKVMEWLEEQSDASSQPEIVDTSALTLLETMKVKHVAPEGIAGSLDTNFTVSALSGSIGIASRLEKPTLSVMYPGSDKAPLILSREDGYTSALFITISDQEYLAAASKDSIHIWNLVQNRQSVAYKLEESDNWYLCAIGERTVACATDTPSSDGFHKIYILNTDTEKFSLSGKIRLKAEGKINDMCHVKTTDGTACLLLSPSFNHVIQCVEMIGGKMRWQVDSQQVGESFFPWGICTDGSTVFITDPLHRLHLVSVEDGSVLAPIHLYPFGIRYPGYVRLQGEHLYIGHMDGKADTYCISRFIKPSAVSDIAK